MNGMSITRGDWTITTYRDGTVKKKKVIKDGNGKVTGTISITTKNTSTKKTKRLQYNFKALSAMLMATKTPNSARQVASKARRKAATLQRSMRTGEYDDEALENAIKHAKRIERIARKRMKHLMQEEAVEKGGNTVYSAFEEELEEHTAEGIDPEELFSIDEEELKQLMRELNEAMRESQSEMLEEDPLDELMQVVPKNMDAEDFERLKKKHRSEELREIMEADMKYLKAMFEKLAREKQNASSGISSNNNNSYNNGVSMSLAGVDMPVAETASADVPVTVQGTTVDVSL